MPILQTAVHRKEVLDAKLLMRGISVRTDCVISLLLDALLKYNHLSYLK